MGDVKRPERWILRGCQVCGGDLFLSEVRGSVLEYECLQCGRGAVSEKGQLPELRKLGDPNLRKGWHSKKHE